MEKEFYKYLVIDEMVRKDCSEYDKIYAYGSDGLLKRFFTTKDGEMKSYSAEQINNGELK